MKREKCITLQNIWKQVLYKQNIRRLENLTLEQTKAYSLDINPRENITNATM